MPSSTRKRRHHEVDDDVKQPAQATQAPQTPKEPSMLQRIRNMWQFANVCQWLLIFGPVVKVDNFDVDDLEAACLRPYTMDLQEIGLSLLKYLSSHRGLTHELFDEYTRRQFTAKAPEKPNPFGDDELLAKFAEFDVFQKIRVLHQMILLIMMNPEKLREKLADLKDAEHDQTSWRIEPFGWDSQDRIYYLLDDNRIYRKTEAPPPPPPAWKPKKNSQKARAAARASKRRRTSEAQDSVADHAEDEDTEQVVEKSIWEEEDDLGGAKWECIAVTLDDVRQFIASFAKTKDPNEKVLRTQIEEHLLPILASHEERRLRRDREREKELLNLEKMAHAKRSSRIAHKAEHQRQEEAAREAEQKRIVEEAAARKAEQSRRKMERERDNRLMSRENRLKDREARRLQAQEELDQLSEDSKNLGTGQGRISERQLKAEMEGRKKALQGLDDEDDDEWTFDCVCGLHGQVDDGEHAVSCERCNVWQHSKCLGIEEKEAEDENFHFICDSCKRSQAAKEKEASRPTIKIKVKPSPKTAPAPSASSNFSIDIMAKPMTSFSPAADPKVNGVEKAGGLITNGMPQPSSVLQPPTQSASNPIPVKTDGASPSSGPGSSKLIPNGGTHNAFSSPYPALSAPDMSPNKSRAYGTIRDHSSPTAGLAQHPTVDNTSPSINGVPRKISTTPILPPTFPRPANTGTASLPLSTSSPTKPLVPTATTKSNTLGHKSIAPPLTPGLPSNGAKPSTPSASVATPRQELGSAHKYEGSSPLLPPQIGGTSPTKHSPPVPSSAASFTSSFGAGVLPMPSSSPTPQVVPPATSLSPSQRPVDPTPPVKHIAAVQPQPQLKRSTAQDSTGLSPTKGN